MAQLPKAKQRVDYQAPDFFIPEISLDFDLYEQYTNVKAVSKVRRNGQHQRPLILDGLGLEITSLKINGQEFSQYKQGEETLELVIESQEFELEIVTQIDPANNTSLEGLYKSQGAFCTQCEAEGFRKITYFADRPDVLSLYEVKISADKALYPFLLSNGNKVAQGELDNGRHWVQWQDPFNKPSYLFALVAGDFDLLTDSFTTHSGRDVALELFVDKGNLHRGQHALDSLKKSMAWDEKTFGLEYDLDIYMVVAVDFFNMGAMENKGLNIFNSKYVLADADSATDEDYFNIESVIAHEYFHNWTGNRVTCRDWFQLSLKEGLTVFRDQQFSSDMSSPLTNRIRNVKVIREHQFAEDAGPMSHPIRPESVIEMNNFYTVTVYDKGAEVIRMMYTLLGSDNFRKGMDLYFERFDGQAVTCDDFVQAMQDASGVDLQQFRLWYSQSGTPELEVKQNYDPQQQRLTISIKQQNKPTADQAQKQPLHIPLDIEIMDENGNALPVFGNEKSSKVIDIKQENHTFAFDGIQDEVVMSLLRNFSAPVLLNCDYKDDEYRTLILNASDQFNRWDAMQKFLTKHMLALISGEINQVPSIVVDTFRLLLEKEDISQAMLAELLTLPGFETLAQQQQTTDIEATCLSLKMFNQVLARELSELWLQHYQTSRFDGAYQYQQQDVDRRKLNALCLSYLAYVDEIEDSLFMDAFEQANNMTDNLAVLKACQQDKRLTCFELLMQKFEQRWRQDNLVLDKWFSLHATTERADIISRLQVLKSHQAYTINNPNRVRSVMGSFAFYNVQGFHAADGSGYQLVTDYLLQLDKVNPQVASRIVTPLLQWKRYDSQRQSLLKAQLKRLAGNKELSKDLFEKVSKSLELV